ncbi:MAG: MMPL family transporter [Candidatus Poseidoniaceae archaeon]|jgi:RND superfamily putative drug exporter|nr:MMPL family transporter [Candidatus Poseidoniaceae archaeon]
MEGASDPKMLEGRAFYKLGEFTFDHKKKVLVIGILACFGMASLMTMGPNWAESWGEGDLESMNASKMYNDAFTLDEGSQSFIYLVHHPTLDDTSSEWQNSVIEALAPFADLDNVSIEYSWDKTGDERNQFIHQDEDGFWALNIVTINLDRKEAKELYANNWGDVVIDGDFETWRTGGVAIDVIFDKRIQDDLITAELISGPLSLIILVIVFGTIIAALLPIGIGLLTVLSAMGVTIWLSNVTDVTQYAVNIISLIGIGVSIDYSLFMVNRFREEITRGHDVRTATAMSVATAGKAVFFSGVTVGIGLMGMLFFENTGIPSLGIGGTLAVTVAMIYSLIVLPSILAMLGTKVSDGWKLPFSFKTENDGEDGIWSKIANTVMERPWAVLIPTLIILLGSGLPFFQAEFSMASRDALPPDDETRIGFEHLDEKWPESAANSAMIVIDFDGEDPLHEDNIRLMYRWANEHVNDSRVLDGFGYALGPVPGMSEDAVVDFWQSEELTPQMNTTREYFRHSFLANNITYFIFSLDGPITGEDSREFVSDIRDDRNSLTDDLVIGSEGSLQVAGFAAYSLDTLDAIEENLPMALAFIFISTMVLIFIQVRSVIIPIKAIVMNILSISASFGMLVFVFQWGYGSDLLNFTPQPIEATNPVIMFCIVFGLSMDYEVLMLSRIHEEWERTGDNRLAVANGLQRTGRLITGAAAIMIVVFSAFGLSSLIILQQIGFGLALAILIDATIVRALVVPATMRLMGKWNWWSPSWLPGSKNTEKVEESEE